MTADRLLRLADVEKLAAMKRASIYRKIANGQFPPPVQLGARRVAWRESDIVTWQQSLTVGVRPIAQLQR